METSFPGNIANISPTTLEISSIGKQQCEIMTGITRQWKEKEFPHLNYLFNNFYFQTAEGQNQTKFVTCMK